MKQLYNEVMYRITRKFSKLVHRFFYGKEESDRYWDFPPKEGDGK